MDRMPTVFVVDEDVVSREAVRRLAGTLGFSCQGFSRGEDFLGCFDPDQPGCLVAELRVPDMSGMQLLERVTSLSDGYPVIFLTAHATVATAVGAVRAGAFHLLEKPFREHELWETVQYAIRLDRQRRLAVVRQEELKSKLQRLTAKEERVLELLADGRSNKEMAAELGVTVRTIEFRRAKLMKKMGARSRAQLLHLAIATRNGRANGHEGDGAVVAVRPGWAGMVRAGIGTKA